MRWLAMALGLLCVRPAMAQEYQEPPPWEQPAPGEPGKMTVAPAVEAPSPLVPMWLSASATLAVVGTGMVLAIPELSIKHVFGFAPGADRERAFIGMGLVCLGPALGFGLSGAHLPTVITAPILEAAAIAASFGMGYATDQALNAGNTTVTKILYRQVLGYPLIVISVVVIAATAVAPVLAALISGSDIELQSEDNPGPSFGVAPTRGGFTTGLAWAW